MTQETALTSGIDRDRELVALLREGAPQAADRLVTGYGDRAYRLAVGITGNGADAEEVVQDALWNVVRRIDTFRAESAFGTWLYRIVANAAYQKLRVRAGARADIALDEVLPTFHETDGHGGPIADWAARAADPARRVELRMTLTSAIVELSVDYRGAFVLRDVEGLSNAEVAEALGLTVANVKSRVHRARLFLRKRLGTALSPAA